MNKVVRVSMSLLLGNLLEMKRSDLIGLIINLCALACIVAGMVVNHAAGHRPDALNGFLLAAYLYPASIVAIAVWGICRWIVRMLTCHAPSHSAVRRKAMQ